jgi:hypothetical protein
MELIEKTGAFYLGRVVDPATGKTSDQPLQLESKDLTTHAVCVGMTGSGKTGLGIALLEEAAIDGIPAIIIDPKGDLGNMLLSFPALQPSDFLSWIDEGEASRKGMDPEKYAGVIASTWKEGLTKWGQSSERIQRFKDAVDVSIYTPASQAGIPLSILNSFSAPPSEVLQDVSGAFRERILSTTSGLLGLLDVQADPIKSKEHILISTILEASWKEGRDLDLPKLIQQIQNPPFDTVGVFPLDTFYPPKDRLNLSISLNNLLASPGFSNWMEGEALDIQRLLYTKDGRPRHSILSIAHLSDSERMFFVTLLLNELLAWVRRQTGTSSLRALLYMDEIFGFFPPTASPPSKVPMLTLLKQARAFGLGIVLCTQNPVDLDYKGLSNCGIWFVGKLQTDRDRSRVIEGLQASSKTDLGVEEMSRMLSECGNRVFLMRSVHLASPVLFQTRWTLSYLRGPLTLPQIQTLTNQRGQRTETPKTQLKASPEVKAELEKPILPPQLTEYTFKSTGALSGTYRPLILGIAKMHFVDAKNRIDTWVEKLFVAPIAEDGKSVLWEEGNPLPGDRAALSKELPKEGQFENLPTGFLGAKSYQPFLTAYMNFLYQNQTLDLFEVADLKLMSKDGESEGDFKVRLAQALHEKRDQEVDRIHKASEAKVQALQEKIRKANERLAARQEKAGQKRFDTFISIGKTLLGGLFGSKVLS